jgi:hypothetical protein
MSGMGNYSRQRLKDLQSEDEQGCECRWSSGRAAVVSVSHSVSSLKSDQTKQRKTEERIPIVLATTKRSLTFPKKLSRFGQDQEGTLLGSHYDQSRNPVNTKNHHIRRIFHQGATGEKTERALRRGMGR